MTFQSLQKILLHNAQLGNQRSLHGGGGDGRRGRRRGGDVGKRKGESHW